MSSNESHSTSQSSLRLSDSFGDLIDVGAIEQAQANVCVAQAVGSSRLTDPVGAELLLIENCVE